MTSRFAWALTCLSFLPPPSWAADEYSIETVTKPIPRELKEPLARTLSDRAIHLRDSKGKLVGALWFRKELPSKVTPDQVKSGLTYRELDETTVLGAIQFPAQVTDYRKQKIKPGVYTFRLGFQPVNGDHMGTAPYTEFCLLAPAGMDESPDNLKDSKELQELSTKASGTSHPAVFLLQPNNKPEENPTLIHVEGDCWVLNYQSRVLADGKNVPMGFGLTLIGHAAD